MTNKLKFTKDQIRQWRCYEKVRKGGRYNMFDPRARRATALTEQQYSFVMRNFSELKSASEGPSV